MGAAVLPGAALAAPGDITTVAGNGTMGFGGDGGPAKLAELSQPRAVAALPGGGFLIADGYNCVIRKVSPTGKISTVAGTVPDPGPSPHCGFSGDGGAATAAMINSAWSIAPLRDGSFLIDDLESDCVVRKVSNTRTISTVAGTAPTAGPTLHCGFGGDGGTATTALLGKAPIAGGVAAFPGGTFLIADVDNCLVRRVSGGLISTVAGVTTGAGDGSHSNCNPNTGDGGSATAGQIQFPIAVATFPNGGYLVSDFFGGCRIRRVASGTINTAAGTGVCGYSGDGGPATAAQISHDVTSLSTFGNGSWLIADRINCIVRKVSPVGRIATVAGTKPTNGGSTTSCGYTGDGHPATSATLTDPTGVAAASDGGFLIADGSSNVIRRVIGSPPRVTITRHPKSKFKTRHKKVDVKFGFVSNQARSTFRCKLDAGVFSPCRSPKTYRVKPGTHTFTVRATNVFHATGAPVSFTFTVQRKPEKH